MTSPCREKELDGRRYRCFFELTLQVIGGKWKPIILYHLGSNGVMRFSDLRRSLRDITERMLSRQLKELAKDGLVHREIYKQVPPRVEYWLTDHGQTILPILMQMRDWGEDFERRVLESQGRLGEFDAPGFEPATVAMRESEARAAQDDRKRPQAKAS